MIHFIIATIILLFSFYLRSISQYGHQGYQEGYVLSFTTSILFYLACIIHTFRQRKEQINDIEQIKELEEKSAFIVESLDKMIEESKNILIKAFPEHEKAIFDLIAKANPEAIAIVGFKYPEIASSKGFSEIASRIQNANNQYNEYQLDIIRNKRDIRVRNRDLWVIQQLIPRE